MITWRATGIYMPVTHLSRLADTSCDLQIPKLGDILLRPLYRQLRQNSTKSRRMRAVIWLEILELLALDPLVHVELVSSTISIKVCL